MKTILLFSALAIGITASAQRLDIDYLPQPNDYTEWQKGQDGNYYQMEYDEYGLGQWVRAALENGGSMYVYRTELSELNVYRALLWKSKYLKTGFYTQDHYLPSWVDNTDAGDIYLVCGNGSGEYAYAQKGNPTHLILVKENTVTVVVYYE